MSQILYNYPAMLAHAAEMNGHAATLQAVSDYETAAYRFTHGLMRASIGALEFADVRSRSFALDRPARALLVQLSERSANR